MPACYELTFPAGSEPILIATDDRDRNWAEDLLERLEEALTADQEIRVTIAHCPYRCTVCGNPVRASELREHLGGHHPGGLKLSSAEVRNCFTLID